MRCCCLDWWLRVLITAIALGQSVTVQGLEPELHITICVSNGTEVNDTPCLTDGGFNTSNVSRAFEYANEMQMIAGGISIVIFPGQYFLLPYTNTTVFSSVNNVTISGTTAQMIFIYCLDGNAGLSFLYSSNIKISNITMIGCGAKHMSTSKNFSDTNSQSFLPFFATLYFQQCASIVIDSVYVTSSIGIAVQFYATSGINSISNSNFSISCSMESEYKHCGGIHIEFPYCLPGDTTCNNNASVVPESDISKSVYSIVHNTFTGNNALVSNLNNTFVLSYKIYYVAFGRGGGLSIAFKGNASQNAFFVVDCKFYNNSAVDGGGLVVDFQDNSNSNNVTVSDCTFYNNSANQSGGGGRFVFAAYQSNVSSNNIRVTNCVFDANDALTGGGVSFKTTRNPYELHPTNQLSFTNCSWTRNIARIGAALDLAELHSTFVGTVVNTSFTECDFIDNSVNYTSELGKPVGVGVVYLESVPATFTKMVHFENNHGGSALVVLNTQVYFNEAIKASFISNSGRNGGAISLRGNAVIVLGRDIQMEFINNYATNQGGGIYAYYGGNRELINSLDCFIQYYDITINPKKWNVVLRFENNTVKGPPNAIFATTIIPCYWSRAFGPDTEEMLSKNVFCWNNYTDQWIYNGRTDTQSCTSQILTDPASFNDTNYKQLNVAPGQPTQMNFIAYDDQGGADATQLLIFTAESKQPEIGIDEKYKYISTNSILLYEKDTAVTSGWITLETIGPRVLQTELQASFINCSTGYYVNEEGNCTQLGGNFGGIVQYYSPSYEIYLLRSYWIGDPMFNTTNVSLAVAQCRYCIYSPNSQGYVPLPHTLPMIQNQLCGDFREGRLCAQCVSNSSPSFNTEDFDCVECSEDGLHWLYFLILEVIIPLLMLFVLYIINLSLTSGSLNGAILFAQMITTAITLNGNEAIPNEELFNNSNTTAEVFKRSYFIVYNIWNLEFCQSCFNGLCIAPNTTVLHVLVAEYVVAFFPLLIVSVALIVYWIDLYTNNFNCLRCLKCHLDADNALAKLLKRLYEPVKGNAATFFATLILLTYSKLAVLTCYILTRQRFFDQDNSPLHTEVMYLDGSVIFFGKEHLAYALFVLLTGVPLILIIPLLLILCRSDNPTKNGGFFNHILHEFQCEFRDGSKDQELNFITGDKDINFCNYFQDKMEYAYRLTSGLKVCSLRSKCCHGSCWFFTSWEKSDCRWMSGYYFLLRVLLLLSYSFGPDPIFVYSLQATLCILSTMLILTFQPYKKMLHNILDASWLSLIAILILLSEYQYFKVAVNDGPYAWVYWMQYILLLLPAIWISISLFFIEMRKQKTYLKVLNLCCCCNKHRAQLNPVYWRIDIDLSYDNRDMNESLLHEIPHD